MSEKEDKGSDEGSGKNEDAGEKEQIIREEDEHGCLLVYPAWSKKNAPAENKSKWDVPLYL